MEKNYMTINGEDQLSTPCQIKFAVYGLSEDQFKILIGSILNRDSWATKFLWMGVLSFTNIVICLAYYYYNSSATITPPLEKQYCELGVLLILSLCFYVFSKFPYFKSERQKLIDKIREHFRDFPS